MYINFTFNSAIQVFVVGVVVYSCFFKLYYESVTKINTHTFAIAKIQQELPQEEQQPDSLPVCTAMLDLPLQQQKSNCCGT